MSDEPDELRDAIERLHGVRAMFRERVSIEERFDGQTVWRGEVTVFDVTGLRAATVAYAWSVPIQDSDQRRLYVVLGVPPVGSAMDAVRSVIRE